MQRPTVSNFIRDLSISLSNRNRPRTTPLTPFGPRDRQKGGSCQGWPGEGCIRADLVSRTTLIVCLPTASCWFGALAPLHSTGDCQIGGKWGGNGLPPGHASARIIWVRCYLVLTRHLFEKNEGCLLSWISMVPYLKHSRMFMYYNRYRCSVMY